MKVKMDDMEFAGKLIRGAEELCVKLSAEQAQLFINYKKILLEWNEKINLTAITNDEDFLAKHLLDSLAIAQYMPVNKENVKIIDVGSGAGFPGIPLKIAMKENEILLLDSLNKRIKFLTHVISELDLAGISAIHSRAEDAARLDEMKESFDIAVSRAVAGLAKLSEYCLPFVKANGLFFAMKGPGVDEEIREAKEILSLLGGEISEIKKITLPFSDISRQIIIIKKTRQIQPKYSWNLPKTKKKR